jgi:membrane fusion protein, heavy metal efflux system
MTTEPTAPHAHDHAPQPPHGARSWLGWLWSSLQLLIAVGIAGGVLAYLLLHPDAHVADDDESTRKPPEPVEVAGPNQLRLRPESTLEKRYQMATVSQRSLRSPVVTVTGTVVASMRHGEDGKPDFWQFNAPEMLTTYADWKKATADFEFYTAQLKKIQELGEARQEAQNKVVARKERLVKAGTETEEVLAAERANLIQIQLTAQKDAHEANNAILTAGRTEAALARQLQQAGLDPDMLRQADRDMDVVMADVPEQRFGQIRVGQACEAKFFSLPGEVFPGRVRNIAPVVSKERRTLRVLFQVKDPKDQLRPGMFAEIGLGTDERKTLMMPADGVVHVGKEDYALLENGERSWRVARIKLGETYGEDVEVVEGLKDGDRVMASGAILMKQFIIRATQADAPRTANNGRAHDR